MKYNFDSYMLYHTGKIIRNVVRLKVTMKDSVDIDVLRNAVNIATNRYPYFKKKIAVNEEGAYVLEDNVEPVAVFPTRKKAPAIGSEEVNRHILYVDTEGRDIYFTISHTLAGGKGIQPWVMTCVYQYVTEKYGVTVDAPGIRKPDSDFLPTELTAPSYDILSKEQPIYRFHGGKAALLLFDYINGFVNPFMKNEAYYVFSFDQADFMKFSKINDSSVASLITVLMFKALDRVLPKNKLLIRGDLAHNPCVTLGIPDSHCDFLTRLHVDYRRDMASYDLEKLGTITRGQMILQMDAPNSSEVVKKRLEFRDGIDLCKGLKQKRKYAKKHNMNLGKGIVHGTYNVNYTGYFDWGELEEYVESFVYIVDGHLLSEVSAMGNKIFLAVMALVKADKYINSLCGVLNELGIKYKLDGPFPKNLPYQEFQR